MEENFEVKPKKKHRVLKAIIGIILAILLLGGIAFGIKVAPNYINNEITDKTNLVINYSNVTGRMKHDLITDNNGVIYLSLNDIMNYYDKNIYYDKQYNQIVTSSETKLAVLKLDEKKITINGVTKEIKGAAIKEDDVFYLPISEMTEVYDLKIEGNENKVVLESLNRKLTTGKVSKKINVKSKPTYFSRTIETVEKGNKIVVAEVEPNSLPKGWIKVRTDNGNLGYIPEKYVEKITVERENKEYPKQIEGKISLAWEYFSEYNKAPDNTGKKYEGVNVVSPSFFYLKLQDTKKDELSMIDVVLQSRIIDNVGDEGVNYIKWAHNNGYKVWAKVSNDTLQNTIDEFSYIINDYKLRDIMIKDILEYCDKYKLDGINIDFEYMYKNDSEAFSKFLIELAPQLRNKGICLSVDVTAPNGADNWSLCYDRNVIGEVADYVVFMAYDQYGTTKIGTTSGYNWVENSIKNFLNYEEVPAEKIILGLPFYTKLWQTKGDETIKGMVVTMSNVENSIPSNSSKEWNEDLQQQYIQYEQNGYVYKMWVEDEESFTKKLKLVNQYNLAGAGYWRKGFEKESIWKTIKNTLDL